MYVGMYIPRRKVVGLDIRIDKLGSGVFGNWLDYAGRENELAWHGKSKGVKCEGVICGCFMESIGLFTSNNRQ